MAGIAKGELLHEGKAKKVFKTNNPDLYIQEFKDSATAFDGTKKDTIQSKGIVNNAISCALFRMLESKGIRTHLVEQIDERAMLVKSLQILMVEVVVRNVAAGSLCRRLGFKEGQVLDPPMVEFFLKNDELHDPLINDEHAIHLNLATQDELNFIRQKAREINKLLIEYFLTLNLKLIDFKLEFGRHKGEILLGDEISPDTCRLWDVTTGRKMDKDRFRFDLGDVEETYQEVLKRVKGDPAL
jgi:phosphoribosylaminoimidazole-succinocarboxamide synthase